MFHGTFVVTEETNKELWSILRSVGGISVFAFRGGEECEDFLLRKSMMSTFVPAEQVDVNSKLICVTDELKSALTDVTDELESALTEEQLCAVLAHEEGHIVQGNLSLLTEELWDKFACILIGKKFFIYETCNSNP